MSGLESKSFTTPDEKRPFADKGYADVLTIGGHTVLHATFEPGWRWSEHLRPIAGTDSCESSHFLYVLSGRMHVRMNDGTEAEVGPDDVARIEPGHDAWVVGEAPCEIIDFGASPAYATSAE
jgi:mannose-6-phosphate isomerase-like protein (cupin superfamily)